MPHLDKPSSQNEQQQSKQKRSWPVALLLVTLAVSVGANIAQILVDTGARKAPEKQNQTPGRFDYLNSTATFGDLTWTGRVVDRGQRDWRGQPVQTYELVRVDTEGHEQIMHTTNLDNPIVYIDWHSSSDSAVSAFLVEEYQGAAEGGQTTLIAFRDGKETVRSTHSNYGSFVQEFTFQTPDSPTYNISLDTSNTCSWDDQNTETNLLGVTLTAEDEVLSFELPEPRTIPCANIDGVNAPPTILSWDIETSTTGTAFTLPGGGRAFASFDVSKGEMMVSYY